MAGSPNTRTLLRLASLSAPFGTVFALNVPGTRAEINLMNDDDALLSRFRWLMPTAK